MLDKYLDLDRELKQRCVEHESDCETICNCALEIVPKGREKRLEELEIREKNQDHSIIIIIMSYR